MRIGHRLIFKIIVSGNKIKIIDGQGLQLTSNLPHCPIFTNWRHSPCVHRRWFELAVIAQFYIAQPEVAGVNHETNRLSTTHMPLISSTAQWSEDQSSLTLL